MSDPSGASTFGYERRGKMTLDVHQDGSGHTFGEASTYDANGNRSTITYPDGKILTYAYDFADRPVSVQQTGTGSAPQIRARLAIDALMARQPSHEAPEAPRGRWPVGPPSPVQRSKALRAFSPRGLAGNVLGSEESTVPERLRGKPVKHAAFKSAASSPTVFVSAASYEPFGPIDAITYGNTTVQTISYDDRYRVTENKLAAGTTLDDHAYGLDAVGNITGLTDKLNAGYDRSFKYDDMNRLTTANSGSSLWGTATGNGYTYDAMGNLKSLQLGATRTDTFTYLPGIGSSTGLPELKSVLENGATRNVSYDAFGNERSDGKSTFSYSSRELLASDSADVTTYYYDGFRRRTAATLTSALGGGTRETIFDTPMMRMLAETTITTGTPAIAYDYVWFGGRPVAQLSSAGTSWIYADHLGTPLLQTNGSDAVTWQAEHEPYGQVWALRAGDVHQPLRLPGQVAEQFDVGANGASELSYNLMRWYRPGWGRYAEPDPIRLRGGRDLYAYAIDDPTIRMDRTGLSPGAFLHIPGYNYCGQHWTNGQDLSETDLLPGQIGTVPPVDALDHCCLTHDKWRSGCWHNHVCDHGAECACKLKADRWLYRCATKSGVTGPYAQVLLLIFEPATWYPEGCVPVPNPAPGATPF
jgi:RHS repeat-associated protein